MPIEYGVAPLVLAVKAAVQLTVPVSVLVVGATSEGVKLVQPVIGVGVAPVLSKKVTFALVMSPPLLSETGSTAVMSCTVAERFTEAEGIETDGVQTKLGPVYVT